jgi:hypothetical protein
LNPGKGVQDYLHPGISAGKVMALFNKVITLFFGQPIMMRASPGDDEKKMPTDYTDYSDFFYFFIICVNLCNLWAFFVVGD